ncbi:hypothetical protein BU23DRAFT_636149 [Bimuria novae-zelandiae CBS 107.79]|uniref:Uncharacterized protein n=1 Tax=Bimuria novae-zelandiae CBS 107.79 TaxID=1447943 RepID=A0A6A5VCV9_9PLEO|nr:hypothetical protein BU23DRAFT_636149 [Bimuria novae-zelandiae CBS 107.79]
MVDVDNAFYDVLTCRDSPEAQLTVKQGLKSALSAYLATLGARVPLQGRERMARASRAHWLLAEFKWGRRGHSRRLPRLLGASDDAICAPGLNKREEMDYQRKQDTIDGGQDESKSFDINDDAGIASNVPSRVPLTSVDTTARRAAGRQLGCSRPGRRYRI